MNLPKDLKQLSDNYVNSLLRINNIKPVNSRNINFVMLKTFLIRTGIISYQKSDIIYVNSFRLITLHGYTRDAATARTQFLNDDLYNSKNVYLTKTGAIVTDSMVEHLMRHKKDTALGVKYTKGDMISNMEGLLHTFVTPIVGIRMRGDYRWRGYHSHKTLPSDTAREVILSALIQPDFENNNIMWKLVILDQYHIQGKSMRDNEFDYTGDKKNWNLEQIKNYDDKVLKHIINYIAPNGRKPGIYEIDEKRIFKYKNAVKLLEQLIVEENVISEIFNITKISFAKFIYKSKKYIMSLGIMFNVIFNMMENEFKAFELLLPQGYIYTISPPVIFVKMLNSDSSILDRLQMLAIKVLLKLGKIQNLKGISFTPFMPHMNNWNQLYSSFIDISKIKLYDTSTLYNQKLKYAVIIHNNSDGFGQNIETEQESSMDGVVGSVSDAAKALLRNRDSKYWSII